MYRTLFIKGEVLKKLQGKGTKGFQLKSVKRQRERERIYSYLILGLFIFKSIIII